MKDCKVINELLHAYIDKETTPEEFIFVEEHLKNCTDCHNKIAVFNNLKKSMKEKIVFNRAPESLREKLFAIPQRKQLLIPLPLRWVLSFATAIAVLIGGIHFYETKIPDLTIKDNNRITQHLKDCKDCGKETNKLVKKHIKILKQYVTLQIHLDNCPDCRKEIIDKSLKHMVFDKKV